MDQYRESSAVSINPSLPVSASKKRVCSTDIRSMVVNVPSASVSREEKISRRAVALIFGVCAAAIFKHAARDKVMHRNVKRADLIIRLIDFSKTRRVSCALKKWIRGNKKEKASDWLS